jgi:hypothetical protein
MPLRQIALVAAISSDTACRTAVGREASKRLRARHDRERSRPEVGVRGHVPRGSPETIAGHRPDLLLVSVQTAHRQSARLGSGARSERSQCCICQRRVLESHDLTAKVRGLPERMRKAGHPAYRPWKNAEHRDARQPGSRERASYQRVGEHPRLELVGVDQEGREQRLEALHPHPVEDSNADPGEVDAASPEVTKHVLLAMRVAAPPRLEHVDANRPMRTPLDGLDPGEHRLWRNAAHAREAEHDRGRPSRATRLVARRFARGEDRRAGDEACNQPHEPHHGATVHPRRSRRSGAVPTRSARLRGLSLVTCGGVAGEHRCARRRRCLAWPEDPASRRSGDGNGTP